MAGDNLHCQACGHPYTQHHGPCCHRKVGWDEETKSWVDRENCECEEYAGVDPKTLNECVHEFLKGDPVCVQCLKTVARKK